MSLPVAALVLAPLAASPLAAQAGHERMQYRGEPAELDRSAPGVGEWVADLAFRDPAGNERRLSEVAGERGLLIALRDPDCPLSAKLGPKLARLSRELGQRGFGVLVVNVLSEESAAADLEAHEFGGAYAVDPDERLPRALRAQTTTEVFLLDAARTLRYRGMIDDQYGLGFNRPEPERRYLDEALEALEDGERVRVPATQAQGCLFRFDEPEASQGAPVTYHERVSRIVQQNCRACHRSGGVGPFPLETYDEVVKRKGMIEWVLTDGLMPPWFAAEGSGPWANDTSLTEAERADFLAWIAGGTPEGDPANAPLPRRWVEGWTIGEPDAVFALPEPFEVPAEGVVDYQYSYVKTDFPEDRWVQAVEVRPGAPQVVHHALVFVEDPSLRESALEGDREASRRLQKGSEGYFASNAPGQAGIVYPDGFAKRLPAGAWIKFQVHYTPNGTPATDRTEVGLVFATEPVHTEIRTDAAINTQFAIPPKAFDHEVQASWRFPEDGAILSLLPHTHLRGIRFLYELVLPDGSVEELLSVPFYDFNWQLNYELQTPRRVPAGTLLRATAWYDNSEYNPANPDPQATVRYGEQTFEEMMIGYVNWVALGQ